MGLYSAKNAARFSSGVLIYLVSVSLSVIKAPEAIISAKTMKIALKGRKMREILATRAPTRFASGRMSLNKLIKFES